MYISELCKANRATTRLLTPGGVMALSKYPVYDPWRGWGGGGGGGGGRGWCHVTIAFWVSGQKVCYQTCIVLTIIKFEGTTNSFKTLFIWHWNWQSYRISSCTDWTLQILWCMILAECRMYDPWRQMCLTKATCDKETQCKQKSISSTEHMSLV